jgi:branched-chain amino acid transport system ATP-binding protein
MSSFLVTRGLTREFGGLTAVNGVDLDVREGDITGVIGPNGAGKSTLFSMLAGALRPTRGEIAFRGHSIAGGGEQRAVQRGLARTFQSTRLFPQLTTRENVLIGCSPHLSVNPLKVLLATRRVRAEERAAQARTDELLAYLDVAHLAHRRASELAYGDQRRVAIARALATQPTLLLLDEPAAGMNEEETAALRDLLLRLRGERGVSVLIVEHDMPLVMGICDQITVLDHGEQIASGDATTIQNDPRVMEAYLGSGTSRASRRQRRVRRLAGS